MPIRIGTDCSGMEAPVQAMRNLGVRYSHEFSCDVDRYARATIAATFPHGRTYKDVTTRDNTTAPSCDVYIAGFPCQPFSMAGQKQGFDDERGRGKIFFYVRDYIARQKPRAFVLENVAGLKNINKGEYLAAILKSLAQLGTYNVHFGTLNTKEHGVPHNRKRCYIVGIRKDVDQGSFSYPEPVKCPSIERFLEPRAKDAQVAAGAPPATATTAAKNVRTALRTLKREGSDPLREPFLVDCDSSSYRFGWQQGVSPCITCQWGAGHCVTNRGRRLLKTEMMRLQGMDPRTFKVVISDMQLGRQLGNTMSVNVLERLFVKLLPAAGLARRGAIRDRWADGSAVRALAATRGAGFAARFGKLAAKGRAPRAQGPAPALKRKASRSPSPLGTKRARRGGA